MPRRWSGKVTRSGCRSQRDFKHTENVEQDGRGEEALEREYQSQILIKMPSVLHL